MWIVSMDDVGLQLLEDARQPPGGGEIELGSGRQRNEIEPLFGPPAQLSGGMRHEHGAMAEGAEPQDGHQDLVLSAAPAPRGVDMEGEHMVGYPLLPAFSLLPSPFFLAPS